MRLSRSERKVLRKIRQDMMISDSPYKYMFWFIYDDQNVARTWEGGYDLPLDILFRNRYTIEKGKRIVRNEFI